jgi:hypothetical protein
MIYYIDIMILSLMNLSSKYAYGLRDVRVELGYIFLVVVYYENDIILQICSSTTHDVVAVIFCYILLLPGGLLRLCTYKFHETVVAMRSI